MESSTQEEVMEEGEPEAWLLCGPETERKLRVLPDWASYFGVPEALASAPSLEDSMKT